MGHRRENTAYVQSTYTTTSHIMDMILHICRARARASGMKNAPGLVVDLRMLSEPFLNILITNVSILLFTATTTSFRDPWGGKGGLNRHSRVVALNTRTPGFQGCQFYPYFPFLPQSSRCLSGTEDGRRGRKAVRYLHLFYHRTPYSV